MKISNIVQEELDRIHSAEMDACYDMPETDIYADDDLSEEPTDAALREIEAEEKREVLPRGLDAKDYRYHIWRKKAYNGKPRTPIVSKDTIECPHCKSIYNVKELLHPDDADMCDSDIMYALLRLYDFATLCSCGHYLYGYYEEHPVPKWLSEALQEIFHPETLSAEKSSKSEWKQLTFEDIYDMENLYSSENTKVETDTVPEIEIVEMQMDNNVSNAELMQQLSDVNVELKSFCDRHMSMYADTTYFQELKTLKTAMVTFRAKYFTVLNFARMNNSEKRVSIGLLQLMQDCIPNISEDNSLAIIKILARSDKKSSETEIKSLHILSDEAMDVFMGDISTYKEQYDELQTLTKRKMDLSKACIWGK